MSQFAGIGRLFAAIDDRVSPLLLKELRQSVRSRSVLAVLFLLLSCLVILTLVQGMLAGDQSVQESAGAEMFTVLNALVLALCALFVPMYSGIRAVQDRSGVASDLLQTTTIGPLAMVMGKMAVAMLISTLLLWVAAPFMMMTYLFRGIDLPTIAFMIGADMIIILVAVQLGVFVAAMPAGNILKVLLAMILVPMFIFIIFGTLGAMFWDLDFASVTQLEAEAWTGIGIAVAFIFGAVGILFCLSVSMMSSRASNRALLPRVYCTVLIPITLALFLYIAVAIDLYDPIGVWTAIWTGLLSFAMCLSVSERRVLGPRIRAKIPTNPVWRVVSFLFTSGPMSGLCWSALMLILVLSFGLVTTPVLFDWAAWSGFFSVEPYATNLLCIPLYALGYSLLAVSLRDGLLHRWVNESTTGPLAFGLMGLMSIIPFLIAFALDPTSTEPPSWAMSFNTFGILFVEATILSDPRFQYQFGSALIVVSVGLVLNGRWFVRQFSQYSRARAAKPMANELARAGAGLGDG